MRWLIFRIILYILVFISIWHWGNLYVQQQLAQGLQQTSSYVVFVDQDILNDDAKSKLQNGSINYPFANISTALEIAQQKNINTIIIKDGVYNEQLKIPQNTILFGQGNVILKPLQHQKGTIIEPSNNTSLINVTITDGRNNIIIPQNTSFRLYNVTIQNAKRYGIQMEISEYHDKEKQGDTPTYDILYKTSAEITQIPLVRISNSIITNSGVQGLYLGDGRVEIENTKVIDNVEEGIDLHPHLHTTINNVLSDGNGESGLESEIYDNIVNVTNSKFINNGRSGLAFVTHIGTGKILLENNIINNNQRFGIRCTLHKNRPTKPKPFFQNTITNTNNTFKDNALEAVSHKECFTF